MNKDKFYKILKSTFGINDKREKINDFLDFWAPLLISLGLYVGIRSFLAEARYIPSGSMLPSLQINDRLLVEKLTFRHRPPRRGEIVVFNSPYAFDKKLLSQRSRKLPSKIECAVSTFPLINALMGRGDPACDAYIKRIVAIGGDNVFINSKGQVFVNGKLSKEVYGPNYCELNSLRINSCVPLNTLVPVSKVMVLGDNRSNSWDSRFWPGGPFLPESEIIGRAVWRFWPMNRISVLTH